MRTPLIVKETNKTPERWDIGFEMSSGIWNQLNTVAYPTLATALEGIYNNIEFWGLSGSQPIEVKSTSTPILNKVTTTVFELCNIITAREEQNAR